jgi:outer membrane protein assembly factor BamB
MMKKIILALLALTITTAFNPLMAENVGECENWVMYNHDPGRSCLSTNQAAPPFLYRTAYQATMGIRGSVAITDKYAVVGSDDNKIYCYDTDSFRIRWSYKTGHMVRCSPSISGNMVVCGSDDGTMYCLSLERGDLLWSYKTGNFIRSSPLVINNKVVFGSLDFKVYCLDLLTGKKVWISQTGGEVHGSPTYVESDNLIVVGSQSKALYAFEADSGRQAWIFEAGSEIYATCSSAKGRIFFGTDGGKFYSLDSKGKIVWSADVGAHIWATPALIENMVIIPCGYDKIVRCFYQDSGELVWDYRTDNWNYSSPAIGGKYVFFGSDDQKLYCLNWKTGREEWKGDLGFVIQASPVIYCEAVYVGTWGGTVQVFHPGPILEVDPLELDYGEVMLGSTPYLDFKIKNVRADQFNTMLEGKILSDEKHLSFSFSEFSGIENKSEKKIRVTLDPAGMEAGNHQALAKITSNGGDYNLMIRWKVVMPAPPCMKVEPTTLDFGYLTRGQEASKIITLHFDTNKEVQGMVMGEDRWIDVEPVTFQTVGRAALISVKINASRIPTGTEAVGRIVLATKDEVCQQVSVQVRVATEQKIVLTMQVGSTMAYLNQRPTELEAPPYITKEGRTMVPVRFISEAFGANVKWEAKEKKVTITRFDTTIEMWIGNKRMFINGTQKDLSSPPEIKGSRTYLPFRAIAEAMGAEVYWFAETKSIKMEFNP